MKINKKVIIGLVLLVVIAIVASIIYINSRKVKKYDIDKTVTIQGIEISNGKLTQNGNLTTYTANILSKKKDYDFKYIEITVYHGDESYVLKGYTGKKLEKGKSAKITSSVDMKIADAKKVSYKVIK